MEIMETCPSTMGLRPLLRDDLKLVQGPVSPGGGATWTLHDPVGHRFFRVGRREFEILCLWEKSEKEILEILDRKTTLKVVMSDIDDLHRFLAANSLLRPDSPAVSARLRQKALTSPGKNLTSLLAHALFFRIPLVNPDRFLSRTMGLVQLVLSIVRVLFFPALVFALFILLRQWSAFIHTFTYFFTFKGILYYSLAILIGKLAHELGHAYSAKYFGLNVPSMGVAFMVMWPILYTDNTEAWRIKHRGPRMSMVAAGMLVELAIAVAATIFWAWLPDGPARSACFILASATWIKSLAFNMVPFLRFDGYYFLSDWLDIPNLHHRAFAFGRWYMRQGLLGIRQPPPETMSQARQGFLILFAYATWLYRFLLFTGIALMVYNLVFKALGLILFAVEIVWFVGRPVCRELKTWSLLIGETGFTRQNLMLMIFMACLALVFVLPMGHTIHVPALVKSGRGNWLYPPIASRIQKVHVTTGQTVQAGEKLFELDSPDLDQEIRLTLSRIKVLEAQIRRQMTHSIFRDQGQVFQQQLAEARTALSGYRHQQDQLILCAGVRGIIVDIPDGIRSGRWVNQGQHLALLVDTGQTQIEGVVPEADLGRIKVSASARFYPDIPEYPVMDATLTRMDRTGLRVLKDPYLGSVHKGPLPVILVGKNLVVQESLYRIELREAAHGRIPFGVMPGVLRIQAKPRSMMARLGRYLAVTGIRESGF